MKAEDLTTTQASMIRDALHPTLGFLTKLETRLAELGFDPTDRLYQLVVGAQDAVHGLSVEVNYLACKSGLGRSARR